MTARTCAPLLLATTLALWCRAEDARIDVRADRTANPVSHYFTGACLEDVNHEVYGGIYSQMVFGESFQEPAPPQAFPGLSVVEGNWKSVEGNAVEVAPGPGPKLVAEDAKLGEGEASVQIFFPADGPGNAGLILDLDHPRPGADEFTGYEVSLETAGQLVLGRHRHNWEPIKTVPCPVPVGKWVTLSVKLDPGRLAVSVDGKQVLDYRDAEHALAPGAVGLRAWQRTARFRDLKIISDGKTRSFSFAPVASPQEISRMWRAVTQGDAAGDFAIVKDHPFVGSQSQRITFASGRGAVGIENRGLNRWGMSFVAGKPYEGVLWARAAKPVAVSVAVQDAGGSKTYAQTKINLQTGDWQRVEFSLTPDKTDPAGRFAILLTEPGSADVGYAFLQPGEWGRFKGLPVRKDVAEALVAQGLTVLRYGGSMINDPEYRWKKMIGPRDRRPPYNGTWYPYSSNGWAIPDFLNLCEAAGFLGIPDLDINETPQDLADFVEYANGPADSEWGRRRAADGHPRPYGIKYIELGNEEAVDDVYWRKFKPVIEAIWAKDPSVTPVVGDFEYKKPIADPFNFAGAPRIKSLAAHQKILNLARDRHKAVWFDTHVWNDNPQEVAANVAGVGAFIDALGRISPGADYKVCVFEENANNHLYRRALAHARTIDALMALGSRVPVVCAANCLQCQGENDNGWDQGLLFLNPAKVWPQPSYFVTQMVSQNDLPRRVESDVQGGGPLNAIARASADGKMLSLQVTNIGDAPLPVKIHIAGYAPPASARVTEITGQLDQDNTAAEPDRVSPRQHAWESHFQEGASTYTFPPRSFTIIRWDQ